jgi:hypothetical protein
VIVYTCQQRTAEWWEKRNGIPTASEFSRILNPTACDPAWTCIGDNGQTCGVRHKSERAAKDCGRKNGLVPMPAPLEMADAALNYACELVADRIRGGPEDAAGYTSKDMDRGNFLEAEARNYFAMRTEREVQQVGFIKTDDGKFGLSPDGILGELKGKSNGGFHCDQVEEGLELKCPSGKVHNRYLIDGILPAEYAAQVHGALAVTGARCWWFVSYCDGIRPLILKVEPNDYTQALREILPKFDTMLTEVEAKIKGS